MRIVIAPDKFKDSLEASAVAEAVAAGLRRVEGALQIDACPLADGGEGTVEALVAATGGRLLRKRVTGPLPEMSVEARFGVLGDGQTAVIEMAQASGLHLLKPEQRNPMQTTTYGTGELLRAAAAMGVRRIVLGIGGSATTDAGVGCAQACGAGIHWRNSGPVGDRPVVGGDLAEIEGVKIERPLLEEVEIVVACDVSNPLYGPNGAAQVFGPQKGATAQQVQWLDQAIKELTGRLGAQRLAQQPGAGAAGGLGFGMMAFFAARLRSGIEIVIEATGLRQRLQGTDLCITGEGKLDRQSLAGKTPIGVARLCRELGVPCIALAGTLGEGLEQARDQGLGAWFSICDRPMSMEEAMARAPELLANAAANVLRTIQAGKKMK